MASDWNVVLTDNAIAKTFRYLSRRQMRNAIDSPKDIWQDTGGYYLVRTRYEHPDPNNGSKLFLRVAINEDSKEIVITSQTSNHYDLSNYDRIAGGASLKRIVGGDDGGE